LLNNIMCRLIVIIVNLNFFEGGYAVIKKIKVSTVVCGGFIAFSAFFLYEASKLEYWSSKYAPGPGFIPRWAGGAMLVLSIIAFIQSLREDGVTLSEALPSDRKRRINLYVCWLGLIFFLLFVEKLGFVIAGSLLLTALFSRGVRWYKAAIIGTAVTLCFFFIFKSLLQVQVPTNVFGW